MLAVIGLFFGTIITVNLILTWFALNSWSGLVAKNGYVESINFTEKQKVIAEQALLGWKSKMRIEKGHMIYSVKNRDGAPVSDLVLSATVGRPTTEKDDAPATFKSGRAGEYLAVAPTRPGQWQVDIKATGDKGEKFRKIFRFVIKGTR
jgi:nitrogen fixation protein FixH